MTTAWMQRGACTSENPELFHGRTPATMKLAKKVCQQCPVITACLDYALAWMNDGGDSDPATAPIGQYGVWGNTIPSERWEILGRRPSRHREVRNARAS